ncbi:hypothetical protein [Flagellimonas lutaonensis]|uniref:hypothetical protein n=1 Tax=Flagellimonas lutaonensis TaxID=516051 RepID=UPI0012F7119D|nr:hypothetical protein [Allomuricauda lutaonensis]
MAVNLTAEAQGHQLKLEKLRKGKVKRTKIFEEGDFLIIRTYNGNRHKGIFAVNDGQSIILEGGSIVQLGEIAKIRKRNGKLFGGIALVFLGTTTSFLGAWATAVEGIFDVDDDNNGEIATAVGLGTLAGGIFMLSIYNYHPQNGKWRLSIVGN